ncbi:NEDD8-activating enzyme E1 catalytic subunit-like isoform X1 [Portunus trituberculatus]|uniref:NEDD8-activating enzyme E1 catalytic subunit-like isoform X1 n=2 Tax=Portunus trituberculatus TaxID=210409 RepID=UPI001E1D1479|nr:NEDD8-activating enzyme E1 catalytic subunit-like isoform X1 [Portunus trituberculatus]
MTKAVAMAVEWGARWSEVRKLLERQGPFTHPDFEPSPETLKMMQENIRVLVIGAGGLGCELLKDLALMGFTNLHVVDMDTIDLSNLNRQFLFRKKDISRAKAEVAAEFINQRIQGCHVTHYYNKIQDFDDEFYRSFHLVVCGLDSIVARRWINGMLLSLLCYEDGMLDQSSVIPLVDGGTEGFKGNARVILPGLTSCIECTLDLFPPQINFPLCTIAHTPRLPEHCIEWVRLLLWPKENPFSEETPIDGDDPHHLSWIFEKAQKRAAEFGITGVTYRLTQGVVKRIIPAVASTNAVIAAACCTEVFKLATSACTPMNNYCVFNDSDGIYTYTYEQEKKEDCVACSQVPQELLVSPSDKLQDVIAILTDSLRFQMKKPGLQAMVDGKTKSLYLHSPASIEEKLRPNLKKTVEELGLRDGIEIAVADVTSPSTVLFKVKLKK